MGRRKGRSIDPHAVQDALSYVENLTPSKEVQTIKACLETFLPSPNGRNQQSNQEKQPPQPTPAAALSATASEKGPAPAEKKPHRR